MPCKYEKSETDSQNELEQGTKGVTGVDRPDPRPSRIRCWGTALLVVSLFVYLTLNLWWILFQSRPHGLNKEIKSCNNPEEHRSPYSKWLYVLRKIYCISNVSGFLAGLAFDVPIRYSLHTEYNGDNMTHSDEMWDNINLDAMVIAPTIEWAQDMGLTDSWDILHGTRNERFIS